MLTPSQKRHLAAYTCPACGNPIGRIHCYPVTPDTLLSRLTETIPMHPTCAGKAAPFARPEWLHDQEQAAIIWTVKTSSPAMPSGRLFDRAEGDLFIHLHTPHRLDFYICNSPDTPTDVSTMERPTYEQIRDLMLPAIRRARDAAQSEPEIDEIARAIASLHPHLPKPTTRP